VEEAASLFALLITCWQFVIYCLKTSREQLYEFNDALAAMAVRLTCTKTDIEYYNCLKCQVWTESIVDSEMDKAWPILGEAELELLIDKVTVALDEEDLTSNRLQPTKPNRTTRRRRTKKG